MGFKYLTALQLQCYGTGDDERTRTDTFEVLSKVVDGPQISGRGGKPARIRIHRLLTRFHDGGAGRQATKVGGDL